MSRAQDLLSQIYEFTPDEMKQKLAYFVQQGMERGDAKRKIAKIAGAKAYAKDRMKSGAVDNWIKANLGASAAGFVSGKLAKKISDRRKGR